MKIVGLNMSVKSICTFPLLGTFVRDCGKVPVMPPSSLTLVPPAPFPQPLASDVDAELPAVIVDEADLPAEEPSKLEDDDPQVEPLASHPQGVDAGEAAVHDHQPLNGADDGMIRDSLTLGELRRYVEGAAFKVKVCSSSLFCGWEVMLMEVGRNRDSTRLRMRILSL